MRRKREKEDRGVESGGEDSLRCHVYEGETAVAPKFESIGGEVKSRGIGGMSYRWVDHLVRSDFFNIDPLFAY